MERLRQREAGWVSQAKKLIGEQKPFVLHYHGKDRLIQYAEVAHHDGREYLHCWDTEPNEKAELPELAHNRLFLCSEDAIVNPAPDEIWRTEGLGSIETSFRVAFRYRPKPEDQVIAVEAISIESQPWTIVTQRITHLLWFLQRIARYHDRCIIERPETIRKLRIQQIHNELRAYQDIQEP